MRLHLHIGAHKTGTTAVQTFFAANRDVLREMGVLYPTAGCPTNRPAMAYGQHLLPHAITRPKAENAGAWDALRTELAETSAASAFVSSEEFDVLRDEEHFAELVQHLEGIPVSVIVYLRRQDEFLHSYYCTDVLWHGESRPFHEYRRNLKTNPDYRELLAGWERNFGKDAIRVRVYEKNSLRAGDVVADICGEIGIDPDADFMRPAGGGQVNRAYPRNVINCILWARKAGMRRDELSSLRSLFNLVYRDKRTDADFLSPDERRALLQEFAASNSAIARDYLGQSELFRTEIATSQEEWHRRYGGPLADLTASIADAQETYHRLHAPREARGAPRPSGE